MIEIALCLAIVGFALVAIVGVLPAGLNVQRDNREETIINQDSTVWIDAIRNGGRGFQDIGYDDLTNYVDRIVVERYEYDDNSNRVGNVAITVGEFELPTIGNFNFRITNGARIVGLLTTPKIIKVPNSTAFTSNHVYAYVRAINGGASEKTPQANLDIRDTAFRYRMVADVSRATSFDPENILTNAVDRAMRRNLHDVRLLCRWPMKPFTPNMPLDTPTVGNNKLVFRTQASGVIVPLNGFPDAVNIPFYYIQPREFQ